MAEMPCAAEQKAPLSMVPLNVFTFEDRFLQTRETEVRGRAECIPARLSSMLRRAERSMNRGTFAVRDRIELEICKISTNFHWKGDAQYASPWMKNLYVAVPDLEYVGKGMAVICAQILMRFGLSCS